MAFREISNLPTVTRWQRKGGKPSVGPQWLELATTNREIPHSESSGKGQELFFYLFPALPSRSPNLARGAISVIGEGRMSPIGI